MESGCGGHPNAQSSINFFIIRCSWYPWRREIQWKFSIPHRRSRDLWLNCECVGNGALLSNGDRHVWAMFITFVFLCKIQITTARSSTLKERDIPKDNDDHQFPLHLSMRDQFAFYGGRSAFFGTPFFVADCACIHRLFFICFRRIGFWIQRILLFLQNQAHLFFLADYI